MSEQTAVQQMVNEETAENMIADFEEVLEEESNQTLQGFEVTFTVTPDELPHLIEELKELTDG